MRDRGFGGLDNPMITLPRYEEETLRGLAVEPTLLDNVYTGNNVTFVQQPNITHLHQLFCLNFDHGQLRDVSQRRFPLIIEFKHRKFVREGNGYLIRFGVYDPPRQLLVRCLGGCVALWRVGTNVFDIDDVSIPAREKQISQRIGGKIFPVLTAQQKLHCNEKREHLKIVGVWSMMPTGEYNPLDAL